MRAFRAAPDGLEAVLEPVEREVLGGVVRDVLELLLADGDRSDDQLDDEPDEDADDDPGLAPFAVPAAALPPADPAL
ncbi:hypothetical protein, partial [Cellulomonas citrea]|uniref:DUF2017 family protein n=1 Tax=Cellulomonas citrea TaxID=1909423 RepID=UPI003F69BB15